MRPDIPDPALVWVIIRVLPKPSRIVYPCQRVAGPIALSFLLQAGTWFTVWVYDSTAARWDGNPNSDWWDDSNTSGDATRRMVASAVTALTGQRQTRAGIGFLCGACGLFDQRGPPERPCGARGDPLCKKVLRRHEHFQQLAAERPQQF